jgi:hypothetical protein
LNIPGFVAAYTLLTLARRGGVTLGNLEPDRVDCVDHAALDTPTNKAIASITNERRRRVAVRSDIRDHAEYDAPRRQTR